MSKITGQDKQLMINHLRELSKLSMKGNIKHHTVIEKNLSHTIEMTNFMKEDRAKIDRLNNVIDMKQREIDELNSKQMDLLWDLSRLQKENGELTEYKQNNEREVGYWEKKIMSHIKKGKDN